MESKNKLELPLREAVESQVIAFREFSGKNYLLDSLLQNLTEILIKFPADSEASSPVRKKIKTDVSKPLDRSDTKESENQNPGTLEVKATEPSDIFTIDLVMLKTMAYLSDLELKTCRLVNSKFNAFATEVLTQRNGIHIKFKYCPETSQFLNAAWMDLPQFELSNFTTFLKTCSNFPCNSFSFESGSLCVSELQEFLYTHGSKVKCLSLDCFKSRGTYFSDSARPTLGLLRKLLLEQVSNLVALELKKCPEEWNSCPEKLFTKSAGNKITLPKLKSLTVNHGVPESVFGEILEASTKLQELKVDPAKYTTVMQASSLHLLRFYSCLLMPDSLEFYGNLPYSQFRCKELWLNIDKINSLSTSEVLSSSSRIIANLLQANSKTLNIITFGASMTFFPNLQIPEMPKVNSVIISLSKNSQNTSKVFPPGFEFTSAFPKLTKIILDLVYTQPEDSWWDFFDSYEPVTSVKYLVLQHVTFFPLEWMSQIFELFPNIQTFEINQNESVLDFDAICPSINCSLSKHLKVNFTTD